jgi:hypothetical protein
MYTYKVVELGDYQQHYIYSSEYVATQFRQKRLSEIPQLALQGDYHQTDLRDIHGLAGWLSQFHSSYRIWKLNSQKSQ